MRWCHTNHLLFYRTIYINKRTLNATDLTSVKIGMILTLVKLYQAKKTLTRTEQKMWFFLYVTIVPNATPETILVGNRILMSYSIFQILKSFLLTNRKIIFLISTGYGKDVAASRILSLIPKCILLIYVKMFPPRFPTWHPALQKQFAP